MKPCTLRFQTVLKGLARSKKHAMQSIINNYLLLDVTLNSRAMDLFDWTVKPARSTTAAFVARDDSADKKDRNYMVKGAATLKDLSKRSFELLRAQWELHSDTYGKLVARFKKKQDRLRPNQRLRSISDWNPLNDQLTIEERRWTQMKPRVTVHVGHSHTRTRNLCHNSPMIVHNWS